MKKWKCSTPYLKSRVALVLTLKTHNKNLHIFSRVEEKKTLKSRHRWNQKHEP